MRENGETGLESKPGDKSADVNRRGPEVFEGETLSPQKKQELQKAEAAAGKAAESWLVVSEESQDAVEANSAAHSQLAWIGRKTQEAKARQDFKTTLVDLVSSPDSVGKTAALERLAKETNARTKEVASYQSAIEESTNKTRAKIQEAQKELDALLAAEQEDK